MPKEVKRILDCTAIIVLSGANIVVTETLVLGFRKAILVEDFPSSAVLQRCKILGCGLAISSLMDTTVMVKDCELTTKLVLKLGLNENGRIKFRRNSVLNAERTAVILTDREPKVLDHDVHDVRIELDEYSPTFRATQKSRE